MVSRSYKQEPETNVINFQPFVSQPENELCKWIVYGKENNNITV